MKNVQVFNVYPYKKFTKYFCLFFCFRTFEAFFYYYKKSPWLKHTVCSHVLLHSIKYIIYNLYILLLVTLKTSWTVSFWIALKCGQCPEWSGLFLCNNYLSKYSVQLPIRLSIVCTYYILRIRRHNASFWYTLKMNME